MTPAASPGKTAGPPDSLTRTDLRRSTQDAVSWGVMTGIGEFYFVLFALAVQVGEVLAGLVSSLPMVAGGLLQLVSPAMVRRLGSHKRWVVLCAHVQAAAFLPLVIGAIAGWMPAWMLFASVTLYWAAGMGTGSAWNTWITTIVPPRVRSRYFASRTRLAQVGILGGLIAGGLVLELLVRGQGRAESGVAWFALLFGVALLARVVSANRLAATSEPVPMPPDHRSVGWRELISTRKGPAGRVLVYMLAVQVFVQLSGPYFGPYMRVQLGMSYLTFMTLAAASFVGKMAGLSVLGVMPRFFGPRRMLWVGGLGIIPMAGLWVVSDAFWYLLLLQMVSGVVWATYEMGTSLLVFETVPPRERTSVLTMFNAMQAGALAAGSLSGGALLASLGKDKDAYHTLFLLSSGLRLAAVGLLAMVPIPSFKVRPLLMRPIAVRLSGNTFVRPILGSLPDPDAKRAWRRRRLRGRNHAETGQERA
ncbi:MAG: MFS transporter [Phycisphaerales bacterium]|nr:MFS transporter [Phycisphaerales bacterium]MCB9840033.1 MFS transporter [Phycisphaeraceae bacterium]